MGGVEPGIHAPGDEAACPTNPAISGSRKACHANAESFNQRAGQQWSGWQVPGSMRIDGRRQYAGAAASAGPGLSAVPGKTTESRPVAIAWSGSGNARRRSSDAADVTERRPDGGVDQEKYFCAEDVGKNPLLSTRRTGSSPVLYFFDPDYAWGARNFVRRVTLEPFSCSYCTRS